MLTLLSIFQEFISFKKSCKSPQKENLLDYPDPDEFEDDGQSLARTKREEDTDESTGMNVLRGVGNWLSKNLYWF